MWGLHGAGLAGGWERTGGEGQGLSSLGDLGHHPSRGSVLDPQPFCSLKGSALRPLAWLILVTRVPRCWARW